MHFRTINWRSTDSGGEEHVVIWGTDNSLDVGGNAGAELEEPGGGWAPLVEGLGLVGSWAVTEFHGRG